MLSLLGPASPTSLRLASLVRLVARAVNTAVASAPSPPAARVVPSLCKATKGRRAAPRTSPVLPRTSSAAAMPSHLGAERASEPSFASGCLYKRVRLSPLASPQPLSVAIPSHPVTLLTSHPPQIELPPSSRAPACFVDLPCVGAAARLVQR